MYRGRVGYERDCKPILKTQHILRAHRLHLEKIKEISLRKSGGGTLDNTLPRTSAMKHLIMRQKQQTMKNDRNNDIATENRILLQKMTRIITSIPPEASLPAVASAPRPAACKSLNARSRSTELLRISADNHKILARMMSITSQFESDPEKRMEEEEDHKKMLKRLRMVKYEPSKTSIGELSKVAVKRMDDDLLDDRDREGGSSIFDASDSQFASFSAEGFDASSVSDDAYNPPKDGVGSRPTTLGDVKSKHSSSRLVPSSSSSSSSFVVVGGGAGDAPHGSRTLGLASPSFAAGSAAPESLSARKARSASGVRINMFGVSGAKKSAKKMLEKRHGRRRDATQAELVCLAAAALFDHDNDRGVKFNDSTIDNIMSINKVKSPKVRSLSKRISALDASRGEFSIVKQTKGVAILRGFVPVGRTQASVSVTKKRDGRIRVQVKNDATGIEGTVVNCFADIRVEECRKLLGVENKHLILEEGPAAHAVSRKELLELAWGLIDYAQVAYEEFKEEDGDDTGGSGGEKAGNSLGGGGGGARSRRRRKGRAGES